MLAVHPAQVMSSHRSSPWSNASLGHYSESPMYQESAQRQRPTPDVFQNQVRPEAYPNRTHNHSIDRDDLLGPQPQTTRDVSATSPTGDAQFLSDASSTRSSPPTGRFHDNDATLTATSPRMPADPRFQSGMNATDEIRRRASIAESLQSAAFAPLSPFTDAFSPTDGRSFQQFDSGEKRYSPPQHATSQLRSNYLNQNSASNSNLISDAMENFPNQAHLFNERGNIARPSQAQSAAGDEEISTIFVVGFPEDMHEREFQNMFIFSPGFEAATLKTPNTQSGSSVSSSSRDRDRDGSISMMPSGGQQYQLDPYGRPYPSGMPAFDHDDHPTRETPRKQIIGFAKFRTRQEALDARDVLSGRRVDADRDCILKAEVAKKNLHTKRGLANEAPTGAQLSVGVGNPAGNASLPPSLVARGQANLAAAAALDPAVLAGALALQANAQGSSVQQLLRDGEQQLRDVRSQQIQSATYNAFHSTIADRRAAANVSLNDARFNTNNDWQQPFTSASSSTSASVASGPMQAQAHVNLGKSLMQQLDGNSPFPPQAAQAPSAIGQTSDGYTRHAFYNASRAEERAPLSSRFTGLTLNTGLTHSARSQSPQSPGLASPRGSNPADMNPPINTLYVGGLPAVLPSLTGPMSASHLEDSLRAVFSRSPGFKRLNFRQKSNGPMSFVEYDNVEAATRALHELYGHTLGGLVKGGVRLSYSKNPLGVRSNSVSVGGPLSPPLNGFNHDPFSMPTPTSTTSRRLPHTDSPHDSYGARSATSPAHFDHRPFSPFAASDSANGY